MISNFTSLRIAFPSFVITIPPIGSISIWNVWHTCCYALHISCTSQSVRNNHNYQKMAWQTNDNKQIHYTATITCSYHDNRQHESIHTADGSMLNSNKCTQCTVTDHNDIYSTSKEKLSTMTTIKVNLICNCHFLTDSICTPLYSGSNN